MVSDLATFLFAKLFLYFLERKWMKELKMNDQVKVRKLCKIFKIIHYSSSFNDGVEFETIIVVFILRK